MENKALIEEALAAFVADATLTSTLEIENCNPDIVVGDVARLMADAYKLMNLGVFTPEALDSELMKLSKK